MRIPILALVLALPAAAPSGLEKGDESPNFRFEASWNVLEGSKQLTDYRGKVVYLEVWKIH